MTEEEIAVANNIIEKCDAIGDMLTKTINGEPPISKTEVDLLDDLNENSRLTAELVHYYYEVEQGFRLFNNLLPYIKTFLGRMYRYFDLMGDAINEADPEDEVSESVIDFLMGGAESKYDDCLKAIKEIR
jgi:hypothetical protein